MTVFLRGPDDFALCVPSGSPSSIEMMAFPDRSVFRDEKNSIDGEEKLRKEMGRKEPIDDHRHHPDSIHSFLWRLIPVAALSSHQTWMSIVFPLLRSLPLNNLAIPGTHDSCTSEIHSRSKVSSDSPALQFLSFLTPVAGYFVARWSKCQEKHVKQQLIEGIRYFDIRVDFHAESKTFYTAHGLVSSPLIDILSSFAEFIEYHPSELIVLDFNHFYGMQEPSSHVALCKLILSILPNDLIADRTLSPSSMIGEFIDKNVYRRSFFPFSLADPFCRYLSRFFNRHG